MIAAKMFDLVVGVDVHIVVTPAGVPAPMPHPFVGMCLDPVAFLPIVGTTVLVNGQPAVTAGTAAKNVPPHIPIGGTFAKPPGNEGEVFMGSATVSVDGEPFARAGVPVLTCSCIGMPAPVRPGKKPKSSSLLLPTAVLIPVPGGPGVVMVGGPPTVSLMALGMRAGMRALGGLAGAVKKSGRYKRVCKRIHDAAEARMTNRSDAFRRRVHNGICTAIGHPVDAATGCVFTEQEDFSLDGPLPLVWHRVYHSSAADVPDELDEPLGAAWTHPYNLHVRLVDNGFTMELRLPDGRFAFVPRLRPGDSAYVQQERLTVAYDEAGTYVRVTDEDHTTYLFEASRVFGGHVARFGDDPAYAPLVEDRGAKLLRVEHPAHDRAIECHYDEAYFLTGITDAAGRELRFDNDARGRILRVTTAHPSASLPERDTTVTLARYEYDGLGDLRGATDAEGGSFSYRYANHLLVQETNRVGLSFYFQYDDTGEGAEAQCVRTWGDGGIHDNTLVYDVANKVTTVTDSLGAVTEYHHDGGGLVTKTIDPHGAESRTIYGPYANLVAEYDELGRRTEYGYDALGHVTTVTYADGASEMYVRKGHDLVVAKDRRGGGQTWTYDERHRVVAHADAGGARTQYTYEGDRLVAVEDGLGARTELAYDEWGGLLSVTTADGAVTRYARDRWWRVREEVLPTGAATRYERNLLGDAVVVRLPDGGRRELAYDGERNVVRAVDAGGAGGRREIGLRYAGMNRLVERREGSSRDDGSAEAAVVRFEYDTQERLTAVVNEAGARYTFALDGCGRIIRERGFDGLTRRYRRDAAGQVTRVERPGGRATAYAYDAMARVTEVVHTEEDGSAESTASGSSSVDGDAGTPPSKQEREHYAYDAAGALAEVRNKALRVAFARDRAGRVTEERQGGFVVSSKYDKLGRRTQITSSLGASIAIERDAMGAVTKVTSAPTGAAADAPALVYDAKGEPERDRDGRDRRETPGAWSATFERDALGEEVARSLPGGVRARYERDGLGRVTRQHVTSVGHPKSERGSGPRTYERTYRWDRQNQLREIAEAAGILGATTTTERRFSHDARGRLTGASYSDGRAEELRLPDAVGNLFRTAGKGDREYGASGQLLRGSDGTRYGYDAEGNLVTKATADGKRWQYRWTGSGMLREVVRPDGARVRMTYDGLGRRVAKAFIPGGAGRGAGYVDRWVWDGNVMLHEWRERRVASRAASSVPKPEPTGPSEPTPAPPERRRLRFERSGDGLVSAPAGGAAETEQPALPVTATASVQATEPATGEPDAEEVITGVNSINAELTTWVMEPGTFRPLARLSRDSAHAIVTDHLGTPIRMYDRLGRESGTLDFTVYGKEHGAGFRGWMGCPFRYPGQYADAETGLYYNRFRYYDPVAGQYISQDPIGLAGGNPTLYGYVGDVCVTADVFGLSAIEWVNPNTLNFSQAYVTGQTRDYEELMKNGAWDFQRSPLNVITVEGQDVSLDNRRLLAAQNAGVEQVAIQRVKASDPMPNGGFYGKNLAKKLNSRPKGRPDLPKIKLPVTGASSKPTICG